VFLPTHLPVRRPYPCRSANPFVSWKPIAKINSHHCRIAITLLGVRPRRRKPRLLLIQSVSKPHLPDPAIRSLASCPQYPSLKRFTEGIALNFVALARMQKSPLSFGFYTFSNHTQVESLRRGHIVMHPNCPKAHQNWASRWTSDGMAFRIHRCRRGPSQWVGACAAPRS